MTELKGKYLTEVYTPLRNEMTLSNTRVTGNVPKTINGVILRNGPSAHYTPKNDYHLFDGDGMVHGIYFINGEIYYMNKWVKTERWKIESRFNQSIFGGILGYKGHNLSSRMINKGYNTSNTNFVWHHNKLHSLWEFGYPYEIDPHNLNTLGISTTIGKIKGAFTAHPKIDCKTGELFGLCYNGDPRLPPCTLWVFGDDGRILENRDFQVPYRSMIHDFMFTANYFIIPVFPAMVNTTDTSKALIDWNPDHGAHIGIVPRTKNDQNIIWFNIPVCYVYHFVNAFEESDLIVVDAVVHENVPLFTVDNHGSHVPTKRSQLMRWTFNLTTKTFSQEALDKASCYYHFPICDQRLIAKQYRYIFASAEDNGYKLIKYDLQTRRKSIYYAPKNSILSEPIFIPMSNEEGNGYVVIFVSYKNNKCSEMLLFDSKDCSVPLAISQLPQHMPFGFHGIWIPNIMPNR